MKLQNGVKISTVNIHLDDGIKNKNSKKKKAKKKKQNFFFFFFN